LTIVALATLGLALAFSEVSRRLDQRATRGELEALKADVDAASAEAAAALAAVIAPETLSAATASVYLIVVNGNTRGTAFVVDRDKGVLATAGHTADSLPLDDPKADVHILNRDARTPIKVTGKRVHKGFGAFRALVESYQPIRKNTSIYAPQAAPVRDLAFDAGLITVDPLDASGQNRLGPNLQLASEEKLLALSAGSAIAIIGYPYDTLDDGFAADAAISRIERGVVAAVMPPLDAASEEPDPRIANLIIHRLSTAGGSSGSPVIDADGEVVGVHTHGIESTSSNADGAAQRADILHDLMIEGRDASRLDQVFLPAWSRILRHWARAVDVLPWSFYKEYAEPGEDPAPVVGSIDFAAPRPFFETMQQLSYGEAKPEHRVAAPDAATTSSAPAFLIKEPGEFAEAWFAVDRSREAVLFAYDYSLRARSGSCRIAAYWRKKGETRLAAQRQRASFELYLPADGPRTDEIHVVFRRDAGCDPLSKAFFAGQVEWAGAAEIVSARYEDENRGPFARLAHSVETSLKEFVGCALKGDDEACEEPRYIELETR
jgi:hypothetical protein